MELSANLLSILIWLPIFSGVLLLLVQKTDCFKNKLANLVSLFSLGICAFIAYTYDTGLGGLQFQEKIKWIDYLQANYYLAVDGISLPLLCLSNLVCWAVIFSNKMQISSQKSTLNGLFLLIQGLLNGAFVAMDALLFYMFFEVMIIPLFFIIGLFGGKNKLYATMKFVIYTFIGSIFLLISIIILAYYAKQHGSPEPLSITSFYALSLDLKLQCLLFILMAVAFAIKVPMVPVHTWLPAAHVQAPTGGSIVLAAITLKLGGYGFLRFILPVVPNAAVYFAPGMIILSLVAICYISLVAIVQHDLKKMIAYSSIAHMGFVTLGLFLPLMANKISSLSFEAAYFQMISHGFVSVGMFYCAGILYDKMLTKDINSFGGIAVSMPIFASLFMVFVLANIGLPGTSGFVGEFFVILASMQVGILVAGFSALAMLLGATYSLSMYKKIVFGPITNGAITSLEDINKRDIFTLGLFATLIIILGVYPNLILNYIHQAFDMLQMHIGLS